MPATIDAPSPHPFHLSNEQPRWVPYLIWRLAGRLRVALGGSDVRVDSNPSMAACFEQNKARRATRSACWGGRGRTLASSWRSMSERSRRLPPPRASTPDCSRAATIGWLNGWTLPIRRAEQSPDRGSKPTARRRSPRFAGSPRGDRRRRRRLDGAPSRRHHASGEPCGGAAGLVGLAESSAFVAV